MKILLLAVFVLIICGHIYSQTWQPMGIPEGNGVTDLVYWSGGGAVYGDKLWATTGSVNWPTGQRGGVFYSAVSGTYQGIWYRIGGSAGHYVGRTLAVGQDGNLYASLWRDPATFPADGLFKFIPQVGDFGFLYQAQAGDNIFSIAVKNNPHTIFAGTRNGIIRSTDNGTTFGYSNNGIPDSSWVYDIAIDSSGKLAIASSQGVFISEDNGLNWIATTGIPPQDTVVTLLFIDEPALNKSNNKMSLVLNSSLYAGTTNNAALYGAFDGTTQFGLLYLFGPDSDSEVSKTVKLLNKFLAGIRYRGDGEKNIPKLGEVGGVYESTDNGISWNQINNSLPPEPPVSALAFKTTSGTTAQLYAGLFNDTTNGAGVYKLDITVDVDEPNNQIPSEFWLEQNYPNPFNPSTTIQFSIPERSFVKLEVFNSLGEKISTLVSEEMSVGNYKYEWNAENLSSGIYYYKLFANKFSQTKKLILLK
jgi:hypothetical protein